MNDYIYEYIKDGKIIRTDRIHDLFEGNFKLYAVIKDGIRIENKELEQFKRKYLTK